MECLRTPAVEVGGRVGDPRVDLGNELRVREVGGGLSREPGAHCRCTSCVPREEGRWCFEIYWLRAPSAGDGFRFALFKKQFRR